MAIIMCPFGHYYDEVRHKECPVCSKMSSGNHESFGIQSQVTVSGYQIGEPVGGVTELLSADEEKNRFADFAIDEQYDAMSDDNSTVGFFEIAGIGGFTAGWLVCVDGNDKGKSFTLTIGRNTCGNMVSNDVVLNDSNVVSMLHCSVVYEPKQNKFFLVPENGTVFYNSKYISNPVELKNNDKILLGDTELVFVPFCNKNRSW